MASSPAAVLAPLVTTLLLLAGCTTESDRQRARPPVEGSEAAMGHIHGIGVDPADATLYAATHFGVFRVEDGEVTRIADRWQDTMAFTVVGENHFLASGHPDLREDLPSHLGLIESTDAGETWRPLALQGEADFHALEAAGDVLYGYDSVSGALMASTDRRTFRTVTDLAAADLAVDPSDAGRVLATTESGLLAVEGDSGETEPVGGAPALMFVDWPNPDLLVGLALDGAVHVSRDGGASWRSPGEVPGQAAALEITDEAWFAASSVGLYRSTDEGATWEQLAAADG